jgi:hypothetical protein
MFKFKILLIVSIFLSSCTSTSEFTGFSYDPPGVTDTQGKEINPQNFRVIGAGSPKVWVSNEFESARVSDFYQQSPQHFELLISPENEPINNSPWYAFSIWSDSAQTIELTLRYTDGRHRYIPKYQNFTPVEIVQLDSTEGTATLRLSVDATPDTISAHRLQNIRFSELTHRFTHQLPDFITVDTVGFSVQGRPIYQLTADEIPHQESAGVLVLLSRQHPPEVSGYKTYQAFLETLLSDSELAQTFRRHFVIKAFPMLNPDGVVNGHWRHNAAGIDLNRDWQFFNQPETRAVRDALLPIHLNPNRQIFYGIDFHSTNENIFYPILEEVKTIPDNVSQRWFLKINEALPELSFVAEEFDTSSPISKNWMFNSFGADALTFEVHDELSIETIRQLGVHSAESLMRVLLDDWNLLQSSNQ